MNEEDFMEAIKNIINYDPEVLAVQYDEAQDRYVNDKIARRKPTP